MLLSVSISQLRFLSFQDDCWQKAGLSVDIVSISQLRFLSFQVQQPTRLNIQLVCFNLTIEILIFSSNQDDKLLVLSYRFNLTIEILIFSSEYLDTGKAVCMVCFNLTIEILIFSRQAAKYVGISIKQVSISQLRFLSFQVKTLPEMKKYVTDRVSISQLRFLSFQADSGAKLQASLIYSFNLTIEILIFSSFRGILCKALVPNIVSISQLRFLSFQGDMIWMQNITYSCFNLTIEILIFSRIEQVICLTKTSSVSISQLRFLSFQVFL